MLSRMVPADSLLNTKYKINPVNPTMITENMMKYFIVNGIRYKTKSSNEPIIAMSRKFFAFFTISGVKFSGI